MKKSIFILLLATILQVSAAYAQSVLKGKVTDAQGGLVGVTVQDKKAKKVAVTDVDGNFTLNGASKGDKIEFSYVGYAPQAVVWDGKSPINIVMKEDAVNLAETVVIGYGAVKKKDLTGAVGVVNSSLIENQSTSQLSQSLQGLIPGLTVSRSSSMPGASASIKVRGVTTMGDSAPLILVDGVMVSSLDNVATEDVEQITVLKDAASASIYGARAAAGVILVTTKQAKEGSLSIGYNGEVSVLQPTEFPDFITDPIGYMTMYNEFQWNETGNAPGNEYPTYSEEYIKNYMANNALDPITYPNYDWKAATLKNNSMRTKHTLSMSYGNKQIKSYTTAGYENADAIYRNCSHQRVSLRSRNNLNINQWLSGSLDVSVRYATKNDPNSGSPIRSALMYPMIYAGTYPDGRVAGGKEGSMTNELALLLEGGDNKTESTTMNAKFGLTFKPFSGMTITGNLTPTLTNVAIKQHQRAVPVYDAYETDKIIGYAGRVSQNSLSEERRNAKSLETQLVATYDKSLADVHNFNVMAGYEDYYYSYEAMSASSNDMPLRDFPYLDNANKNALAVGGNAYENAYQSFFGRFMYNYDARYYLQLNAREDGSSRFHKNYRWGFFPSASLGWVVSNEKFMEGINEYLSFLKLRASMGTLGNERIGNYPYQTMISFSNALMYDAAGMRPTAVMSAAQQDFAYNNIHWEKTRTWDLGVDAQFFNNRLDFTADYYYKLTSDMLLSVAIPGFTGYSAPERNAGTMYTNGWEVKIGWNDKIGDVTYGASFNISDYKSIMGNIGGKQVISGGTIITEGEEYKSWYGLVSNGLYQNDEDVNKNPGLVTSVKPGDIKYKDIAGPGNEGPDGIVNETYDRKVLGSSLPHYLYGGSVNVGWKGLTFSMLFNGVGKQTAYVTESMIRPLQGQWMPSPALLLNEDGTANYWQYPRIGEDGQPDAATVARNLKATYPRISYASGESNNYKFSDFWLRDASYLRIKTINLGYSLPKKLISKAGIAGVRVYFNVDDPFCFDNYLKGWDPEAGTTTYITRTYTVGLDLKF